MKESERDRQNAQTDWQSASDWFTQRQSERINTSGGRYDVNNKREPENKAKPPYRESGSREINPESRREKPAAPKKAPEKSRKKDRPSRRSASSRSRNSGKSNDELRLEHSEKTRKHRKRKILQWFVFTALIFVGIFVAASLTVLFHIEEIKVEGDTRYSVEQIIGASEIEEGDNLWRTSAKEVSLRVSTALPYIGRVRLKRSIPSTLTLTIEETSPKYAVKRGKKYVLVDESDKVLEAKANKAGKNTIIEGLKLSEISEGEKLSAESPESYQTAKDVLSCAQENNIKLKSINISDPNNISAVCSVKIRLDLGSATQLSEKMKMANEVLLKLKEEGSVSEGVLNLKSTTKAFYKEGSIDVTETTAAPEAQVTDENGNPVTSSPSSASDSQTSGSDNTDSTDASASQTAQGTASPTADNTASGGSDIPEPPSERPEG